MRRMWVVCTVLMDVLLVQLCSVQVVVLMGFNRRVIHVCRSVEMVR